MLHRSAHAQPGRRATAWSESLVRAALGVMAILRAWHDRCGKPAADSLVVRDLSTERQRKDHDEARVIREDLVSSGMKREILFSKPHNAQRIRFQDGRATFGTWARRAGEEDAWTKLRTGHTATSKMLERLWRSHSQNYTTHFPGVTETITERPVGHALPPTAVSSSEPTPAKAHESAKIPGCEGGDLNPDAISGASTSS
jgi:hypothetical protein